MKTKENPCFLALRTGVNKLLFKLKGSDLQKSQTHDEKVEREGIQ